MGNCQAAEAATVVIHHPGKKKIEKIYWSVSAHQIMDSNPGHYVALIVTKSESDNIANPLRQQQQQLKLLRPDDTLLIGQVYRLISFEDVLKEFASKKSCGKLGRLLKERGDHGIQMKHTDSRAINSSSTSISNIGPVIKVEQETRRMGNNGRSSSNKGLGRHFVGGSGQWRPALQSIEEFGT